MTHVHVDHEACVVTVCPVVRAATGQECHHVFAGRAWQGAFTDCLSDGCDATGLDCYHVCLGRARLAICVACLSDRVCCARARLPSCMLKESTVSHLC